MIDIISADDLIKRFFPSQRQFITDTVGKCLWFCIPVRRRHLKMMKIKHYLICRQNIALTNKQMNSCFRCGKKPTPHSIYLILHFYIFTYVCVCVCVCESLHVSNGRAHKFVHLNCKFLYHILFKTKNKQRKETSLRKTTFEIKNDCGKLQHQQQQQQQQRWW